MVGISPGGAWEGDDAESVGMLGDPEAQAIEDRVAGSAKGYCDPVENGRFAVREGAIRKCLDAGAELEPS